MNQDIPLFKYLNFILVFFSLLFFILSTEAREPLPPRFSAAVSTGVYTADQADLMISLDGDGQHNLYVNPQGAYGSDQQWYGDIGLGYRWIKNDAAILGWYLFLGHSQVENSSGFWITNPGLEMMGSHWDARINAYIPVAGRSNELGLKKFNIVDIPVFTGHTEVISSTFINENTIQQIGNGADARVSYQLFRTVPLKGYLGAYFFSIANSDNVRGGAAGMEYWFDDNIRVFANYSYDNYQHSKVVGGLGISFGGVRKHWADPSLSERLMDPVDRYLANLGHGSGIPSKTLFYGMGRGSSSVLVSDSIAFFSQTGLPNTGGNLTLANCTFENPCGPNDFTQASVNSLNSILQNTMFYFNGGTYRANNAGNALSLNNSQSVLSRTANYAAPAIGAERSTFNGAFSLNGNNTLDGVILNNSGLAVPGVNASGTNNLISISQVGTVLVPYNQGIVVNSGSLTIENTRIYGTSLGVGGLNSSLTIESSIINSAGSNTVGVNLNNTNAQITNSQIQALGTIGSTNLVGVNAAGNSSVNILNSGIMASSSPAINTIGLRTLDTASIKMIEGSLSVSGDNTSALFSGSNISLIEVSTTINN